MATYTDQSPSADAPEMDIEAMMTLKAHELFNICDSEKKGFITKRDMQRLQNELPLDPDQLEGVFDSLDDDGNGYLTLEEFTDGFGSFLGMKKPEAVSDDGSTGNDKVYGNHDIAQDSEEEAEQFEDTMSSIGASGLFDDHDTIRHLWSRLRKDEPELLSSFELFLGKVSTEVKQTQSDYHTLEHALRSKSNAHDEEVNRLYEEMEIQIKQEKEKILAEEKARERALRDDLEHEINIKDKQLQELLSRHQEMEERLSSLNSMDMDTKTENDKLLKEKIELENQLYDSKELLEESQLYIKQLSVQQKEDKRERAKAALQISEGIALERESLVKQLDMLRDMNRKLRDERDENWAKWAMGERAPSFQDDDGGGSSRERAGSALDNPDASFSEGPKTSTPISNHTASSDKRKGGLTKQGSIMSNYFDPSGLDGTGGINDIEEDFECDDEVLAHTFTPTPIPTNTLEKLDTSSKRGKMKRFQSVDTNWRRNGDDLSSSDGDEDLLKTRTDRRYRSLRTRRNFGGEESKRSRQYYDDVDSELGMAPDSPRGQPVGANSTSEHTEEGASLPSGPERVFKVVMIGDSGVGKSTFIHQFCHKEFKSTFSATIGVDFQVKSMVVDNHNVALQLWDTAGQERFRSITKQYFRKADGVLVMYDVTSETSFRNVRSWMISVGEGVDEGTVIVLIGNKTDLVSSPPGQAVKTKDGKRLAEEYNALFFETSAKSGNFVHTSLESMARLLQEREDKFMENALKLAPSVDKKKGCCA